MPFATELFNFTDINCRPRRTLAANPRVFPCRMRTMAAGWIGWIVRETETGLIHRWESVARVLRLRPLKLSLFLSLSLSLCVPVTRWRKSRIDRQSGRVPDTGRSKQCDRRSLSRQVDKSRSFDVSCCGIGRGMINRGWATRKRAVWPWSWIGSGSLWTRSPFPRILLLVCSRFGMELDVFDFVPIFRGCLTTLITILDIIRFRSKVDDSNFVMF